MTLPINQIICGDCRVVMQGWPDGQIDCCVTSPPYWGLRSYMPDAVQIKVSLSDKEKEKIVKELALLGIKGIIR